MQAEAHNELVRFQPGPSRDLCGATADPAGRLDAGTHGSALRAEALLQKECAGAIARVLADNASAAHYLLVDAKDQTSDEREERVCREPASELCGALEINEHDRARAASWPEEFEHPLKRRVIAGSQQREHGCRKAGQHERRGAGKPALRCVQPHEDDVKRPCCTTELHLCPQNLQRGRRSCRDVHQSHCERTGRPRAQVGNAAG